MNLDPKAFEAYIEKLKIRARQLAVVVSQALEGVEVPAQVFQGFALIIEGLLTEEGRSF